MENSFDIGILTLLLPLLMALLLPMPAGGATGGARNGESALPGAGASNNGDGLMPNDVRRSSPSRAQSKPMYDNSIKNIVSCLHCPFRCRMFEFSVVASDGHTYERKDITDGRIPTSPYTREDMDPAALKDSRYLKIFLEWENADDAESMPKYVIETMISEHMNEDEREESKHEKDYCMRTITQSLTSLTKGLVTIVVDASCLLLDACAVAGRRAIVSLSSSPLSWTAQVVNVCFVIQ